MEFRKFDYASVEQVVEDARRMGLDLHFSGNLQVLTNRVRVGGTILPNALAVHPMEGSDGRKDGAPGELTLRRYDRFSRGGAGLIWFEAVSVVPEGRASPNQLWINRDNVWEFASLCDKMQKNAREEYGNGFNPVFVMQLTHSGRFSKPEGIHSPIIAYHNPYLDEKLKVDPELAPVDDSYLEKLEEEFEKAAVLAYEAGFHGVDIKCCHRYLNSELLSAYQRQGRYGGTFEGRTRFLFNVVDRIRNRLGSSFIIATRLNIYDGIPYPYGWGVDREDYRKYDMTEPLKLIKLLYDRDLRLINITMGTPYYNPHVNRPYDAGGYAPPEHPLEGVARLVTGTGIIQKAFPDLAVVGTGYSWLRHLSPFLAAGIIENGLASVIGYGREAFAYPDYARDILNGGMEKDRCCICCGKCAKILRAGGLAGCVVRDYEVYGPIYRQYCLKK